MTQPLTSIWTYPWDVQDLGLDSVTTELRERAGLNRISLASAYHAGRFLQPRSPRRASFSPEDGTIYFRPDAARWAKSRLQPQVASLVAEGDVLRDLVAAKDRTGLSVAAWTVCLHNSRLGTAYPDVATESVFGERYPYALCPSHPDARNYVCTLVEDLTHGCRVDAVELETIGFMGYAHGLHHEKDGVGLTAEDDLLLSLCFCSHCRAGAAKAGVDVEGAAATARDWLTESFGRAVPAPRLPALMTEGLAAFAPWPALHAYLLWRKAPVMSLIAEIRARAHPDSAVYVIDLAAGWLGGVDQAGLRDVCDGLILCAYDIGPAEIARQTAAARRALGSDRYLGTGLRVFYPEVAGPEVLAARVAAAAEAGAQGVNFYNYGLIPAPRLDWIKTAGAALRAP
ncbi:hypothetical protein ACELLULO517_13045 [Acidisoma cellulosilytica]|uniref:Uncharacterized protein n=1 Tax=Acidisoma cellulosilyticum TaxID=2802395 RepID=A0A963Z1K3_9PROT|nr:hypothetical protein [Acidisoma cellulosilyticum]MCB8881167.1 hypothetical protein [Acidisoma cellulosilyticum]